MSYSTLSSILTLLPGLPQTTTSTPQYTATAAVITPHITRADNLINSKISKRYDVSTFDVTNKVPPLLITLSEDITTYYTFRSLFSQDNQNFSEYTDKFKEAIDVLNEIRDGNMDLVNSTGSIIDERTADNSTDKLVDSNTMDTQTFFDIDDPTEWKFDDSMDETVRDSR